MSLHLPEEPAAGKAEWLEAVHAGAGPAEVAAALADWLWDRWRALAADGMDRDAFGTVVAGYRREAWLWLVGERTWAQCCAGLIGRVERRLPVAATTPAAR